MDYGIITERRRGKREGGREARGARAIMRHRRAQEGEGSAEGASGGVDVGVRWWWWWWLTAP